MYQTMTLGAVPLLQTATKSQWVRRVVNTVNQVRLTQAKAIAATDLENAKQQAAIAAAQAEAVRLNQQAAQTSAAAQGAAMAPVYAQPAASVTMPATAAASPATPYYSEAAPAAGIGPDQIPLILGGLAVLAFVMMKRH